MRSAVVAVALITVAAVASEAQPNCRKGKPCGNTCIAQNRTCRVGPPSPASTTPRAAPSQANRLVSAEEATPLPWLAGSSTRTYYASACAGASRIPTADRTFFRLEEGLQRIGYTRAAPDVEACTLDQLQEHERRLALAKP